MPEEKERAMDVLTVGMMVWYIPIAPVPKGIFDMEKAEITASGNPASSSIFLAFFDR